MLTKSELRRMIVGLVEVNDANLLDQVNILSPDVCAHADHAAIRGIRDLVNQLYLGFDYLASPRFKAEIKGKSPAFSDMLRKRYTDPVRRAEWRRTYGVALTRVLDDDQAYTLTKTVEHGSLDRLRELLSALENPGFG
jgi:hypothetical protein